MKTLDDFLLFLWNMVHFTVWVIVVQSSMYYLSKVTDHIKAFTGEQAFHFVFAVWVIWQFQQINSKEQDDED